MSLFSALKKISKRKKLKSYYNSDLALTLKEKQSIIICGFFIIFSILIVVLVFLLS